MLRTIYSVVKNKTRYSQDYICLDPRERILTAPQKSGLIKVIAQIIYMRRISFIL
jgi:hypothetical protein